MTSPFGEELHSHKWIDESTITEQERRDELVLLIEGAHTKLRRTGFADMIEDSIIKSSKKKFIAIRGYSHHIEWARSSILELAIPYPRYGLTNFDEIVRDNGLIGATDDDGRPIFWSSFFLSGVSYPTSDTWQEVTIENIPAEDLPGLRRALIDYICP